MSVPGCASRPLGARGTHTNALNSSTHLAPACTPPFMPVPPHTHTSHPRTSLLPLSPGRTKARTHSGVLTLAPLFTGGAAGPPPHAVHACTAQQRGTAALCPSTAPCGTGSALAGTHQSPARPWRWQASGAAPPVPAALPPQRCHRQRQRLCLGENWLRTRHRRRRRQSFGRAVAQPWPAACAPNERRTHQLTRPRAAPRWIINYAHL